MTGLELLPKAKALRPDVPLIMITAYGDADTKQTALEQGAETLFTRPIDFGALRSEIDLRVERAPVKRPVVWSNVRFSNRPVGVKRFQTIHQCSVDVARGLALLFGIGTKALVWGFFSQEV